MLVGPTVVDGKSWRLFFPLVNLHGISITCGLSPRNLARILCLSPCSQLVLRFWNGDTGRLGDAKSLPRSQGPDGRPDCCLVNSQANGIVKQMTTKITTSVCVCSVQPAHCKKTLKSLTWVRSSSGFFFAVTAFSFSCGAMAATSIE